MREFWRSYQLIKNDAIAEWGVNCVIVECVI